MDLNIVIRKGVIYSILISLITVIYIITALILETLFKTWIGYRSLPATIFTITLLVILFQPLKSYIQCLLDKYFFHGSIDQIDDENVKLREEVQNTEKLKAVATMAAGMAHEIKNPLTSIKTFTEYIDKKKDDPEFIQKFQFIVGKEVNRINHIVKQLLDFSKPSDLVLKDTDLNVLLQETLDLVSEDLLKRNIRIVKRYSPLPHTKCDPHKMKQVFLNLLMNAMDSMPSGGIITIETENIPNRYVSIKIQDTGIGMDKKDIPHIFDPFFTKKETGTGLGLSVVHGIIEKHGGKISVISEKNNGTEFKIVLLG